MGDHVLVVGGGGREHSLAWKLAQSPQIKQVYVSPGNAGTEKAEKICNISLDLKDFDAVAAWCKENTIEMVVIGPEDPLANGIVDHLSKAGIKCFGPSAKAAQIEASKEFAKSFMDRHKIPTARWKSFTEAEAACDHINSVDYKALVVKASGLAAGKGVIVAKDKEEACAAVKQMLEDKAFGTARSVVVIEELLEGEEVSCLAFSDGTSIACLPAAQDHKRLLDGDQGLNTGGMGAYCPCPLVSEKDLEVIRRDVLQKAVDGLKAEGTPYIGVLYAGLILTKGGPRTLEFNCRFGDPETQVLMPMLQSDLYLIIKKCVAGDLAAHTPQYHSNKSAVAVVTVSNGYPGSYKKGFEITGLDKAEKELGLQVFHAGTTHKDGKVVTSGGRVLAVVAIETDLAAAARQAQLGATAVQYDGKFFRKDIGQKAMERKVTMTYKDSGVDIGAGDHLVRTIKPLAAATKRSGCTAELGMFGGVFDIKAAGYKDPLLVSGTDGVGTKLKVAQACGLHKTVGVDLVAMCVNDVLAHGAEPLFFLDYFACGKLDVGVASNVVSGVAEGCQLAGCALLGGETAEMPGMYPVGEYDLAGFAVGAVERDQYLPRMSDITEGDAVIGLSSSGIHSNGYSLVRRIVEHCKLEYKSPSPFSEDQSLGEALLTPTKIYSRSLLPVLWLGKIKALAHITGGGLPGNVARVIPEDLAAELDALSWNVQPVFGWLAAKGNIPQDEMACTFNCGIGAVLVTSKEDVDTVIASLKAAGESASHIGSVCKAAEGKSRIEIKNLSKALQKAFHGSGKHKAQEEVNCAEVKRAKVKEPVEKKKVGVLISGTGTNLQALIDWTQNPNNDSSAEIVLVISNKPGVLGLQRAEKAGIATKVIPNKDFKSREEFDMAMHQVLINADVEVVCLAGFMRILSATFVSKWQGKMLNIHPSLLPSFKGHNAHKQVLEAGVRISGCTVHFVTEEVDAGAIIAQESVAVYPGDTEDSLAERVKTVEHKTYPRALELVTSGKVTVAEDGKLTWQ